MADPLLTSGSMLRCPHGGIVTIVAPNGRVTLAGSPIATITSSAVVSACPNAPDPCMILVWPQGSRRVLASGVPVATQYNGALALTANRTAAGPTIVAATQQRVTSFGTV